MAGWREREDKEILWNTDQILTQYKHHAHLENFSRSRHTKQIREHIELGLELTGGPTVPHTACNETQPVYYAPQYKT